MKAKLSTELLLELLVLNPSSSKMLLLVLHNSTLQFYCSTCCYSSEQIKTNHLDAKRQENVITVNLLKRTPQMLGVHNGRQNPELLGVYVLKIIKTVDQLPTESQVMICESVTRSFLRI